MTATAPDDEDEKDEMHEVYSCDCAECREWRFDQWLEHEYDRVRGYG